MKKITKAAIRAGMSIGGTAIAVGDLIDLWAGRTNHPAWYKNYPNESLVNLNFGLRESRDPDFRIMSSAEAGGAVLKGPSDSRFVVALTVPTLSGPNNDNFAPFKEGCAIILNQMRAVATTTAPYTLQDMQKYVAGARALVAFYAVCRRIADTFQLVDTYDADAWRKYTEMCDPVQFPIAQWNSVKAAFAAELGAITPLLRNLVPASMDLMERTKWLFANIFRDSPSAKFSTKVFVPVATEIFEEDGTKHLFILAPDSIFGAGGAVLVDAQPPEGVQGPWAKGVTDGEVITDRLSGLATHCYVPQNPMDLLVKLRQAINVFITNPMNARIAGDLLKAFGNDAFMQIPDFTPMKAAPFVYDPDVLAQIQNLSYAPGAYYVGNGGMPDNGRIISDSSGQNGEPNYAATAAWQRKVITTYKDSITAAETMALTRLVSFIEPAGSDVKVGPAATTTLKSRGIQNCGTEVVIRWDYLGSVPRDLNTAVGHHTVGYSSRFLCACLWSSDDWAPMLNLAQPTDTGDTLQFHLFDVQNWTTMNRVDADSFNNIACLSMFVIRFLVKKQDTFNFVTA